jgi:ADP-ribose pyrophosphatase
MTIKSWSILSEKLVQMAPYRRVLVRRYLLPNGNEADITVKDEGKVITVFAITSHNRIVMCRQYRPGPDLILDELPAGRVDKDEEPLEAAKRELLEETGYESDEWSLLGKPLECAYSTIERFAFLAKNCCQTSNQNLDPFENIDVIQKSSDELILQLRAGMLTDPEVGWMGLWEIGAIISCENS